MGIKSFQRGLKEVLKLGFKKFKNWDENVLKFGKRSSRNDITMFKKWDKNIESGNHEVLNVRR